jgi:S1-C subfamily serine protease
MAQIPSAGQLKGRSLCVFFRVFFTVMAVAVFTGGQAMGQRLSGVENYSMNRPGVVMVRTEFTANVYVNRMKMDDRAFNFLLDSIQRLDTSGAIASEQKLDIVLKEMNNNPGRYFKTTFDYIKQEEEITSTGTGFFITGDGYVATNCHLIERENAFIRRQFILSAFRQITEANISALEGAWATSFTEQQRNLLYNTYASVYSRLFSMELYDLKKNIFVVFRSDRDGKGSVSKKEPANVVVKGLPMPGKDIAILKIDGGTNRPTLRIASEELPRVGEQLYVYGYPGPATNNDFVSAESALEPTLTTGIVSAIKNSVGGWPVIQMDANINHGSSGGPVCNEKGEVVGLTTFGSIENTGGLAAGLNFAIPVAILNEYLDTADITPAMSKASRLFGEGLFFFGKEHYQSALKKFEEVQRLDSAYPSLDDYVHKSRSLIGAGHNRGTGPVEHILFSLLLLGLLAAVILMGRRLLLKRRK